MRYLNEMNERFELNEQLRFECCGDFIVIAIDNEHAEARISTYGGQVLSYRPQGQEHDLMFLSDKAFYQDGKVIRGGMPICWPWFGDDTSGLGRPAHGFARNQPWRLVDCVSETDGSTTVILSLQDSDPSKAVWPYEFDLQIEINVGPSLTVKLTTVNTGEKPFTISQALHTYFNISDIEAIRVEGLAGLHYLDKLDDFANKLQSEALMVAGETDRVYQQVFAPLTLIDPGFKRKIDISFTGSSTAVVWNPWSESIKSLADMDDASFRHFLCVETANAAADTITLDSHEQHTMSVVYAIEKLTD